MHTSLSNHHRNLGGRYAISLKKSKITDYAILAERYGLMSGLDPDCNRVWQSLCPGCRRLEMVACHSANDTRTIVP